MKRIRKPYLELKAILVEKGITQTLLAEELGIGIVTLNKKLNGTGADFNLKEVRYLCKRLGIDPNIFFEHDYSK